MKHKQLFVLFLLAIIASALAACRLPTVANMNSDPSVSGVVSGPNGPTYIRAHIEYELGVTSHHGRQAWTAYPTLNGVSAQEVVDLIAAAGYQIPNVDPDQLSFTPESFSQVYLTKAQIFQISGRIAPDDGLRHLYFYADGLLVIDVAVHEAGVNYIAQLVSALTVLPQDMRDIIVQLVEAGLQSDADFDIGLEMPEYDLRAVRSETQATFVWMPLSATLAATQTTAATPAPTGNTVTLTVGSGGSASSVAAAAAAQGKDYVCVFNAVLPYQTGKAGDGWSASDQYQFGPGECDPTVVSPVAPVQPVAPVSPTN